MAASPVDVAIVGGGIIGAATAAFLAEAGATVRLYERDGIAAAASGRNSGIIQHPFDPVLAGLYRASLVEYRALAAASDGAFALGDEPAGLLYVGRDPGTVARLGAAWAASHPTARPEVLDSAAIRALEPALAPDLVACRVEIGYPAEPASATRAFAGLAARRGAVIRLGAVARPAIRDGAAVGVEVDGRLEPAGRVVVAAGPWTPELLDPGGSWRPIRPVWGVVASIRLADPPRHGLEAAEIDIEPGGGATLDQAAAAVDFSLVTAGSASALGSTFLDDEPDPAAWEAPIRARGATYVPAVADAPLIGMRACARPVARDGRPLVGAVPWLAGVIVAAGHGPWGITTGPGTARLVADLVLGRSPAVDPALDPGRFGRPPAQ